MVRNQLNTVGTIQLMRCNMDPIDRLIRRSEVQNITGMTRYMIDILEEHGEFPKRMQVGHRAVFWSEAEVIGFIEQTKQMRGGE
jgi:prophage regulatory protein